MTPSLSDLVVPTPGELLWTWRKRHRLSVTVAAQCLGVARQAYYEAEHDRAAGASVYAHLAPEETSATDAELLRVRRRRSRVARDDLARCLGISHVWFLALERCADARIVDLWFRNEADGARPRAPKRLVQTRPERSGERRRSEPGGGGGTVLSLMNGTRSFAEIAAYLNNNGLKRASGADWTSGYCRAYATQFRSRNGIGFLVTEDGRVSRT